MHSVSSLSMASNLGFMFGTTSNVNEAGLCVGEITVGEITPLERAVKESITNHTKVVLAQATVDGVKADGIDTDLAELLSPVTEVGKWLLSLAYWEDSLKSSVFCLDFSYIISVFMVITRSYSQGSIDELKVVAPPAMTTVEQFLAVQNAISQAEELIQDGNIVRLKSRGKSQ
ncbi:heat-inducible transcription repressor [Actinidia rufa]|uniref:Heat-inducible transcription repressor n=1 Tax=Actinidia rufa TaxID=165716 RepID=A0A7J0DJQ7_9ERIC|nr:heat-inducible transcription repressor [Actinidia rufa]